jgi:outer membrane protein assembly factor BamB
MTASLIGATGPEHSSGRPLAETWWQLPPSRPLRKNGQLEPSTLIGFQMGAFAHPLLSWPDIPGVLCAFDLATGRERWTCPLPFDARDPVVSGRVVCVGGDDGRPHGVDTATGRPGWRRNTGGEIRGTALAYWPTRPARRAGSTLSRRKGPEWSRARFAREVAALGHCRGR